MSAPKLLRGTPIADYLGMTTREAENRINSASLPTWRVGGTPYATKRGLADWRKLAGTGTLPIRRHLPRSPNAGGAFFSGQFSHGVPSCVTASCTVSPYRTHVARSRRDAPVISGKPRDYVARLATRAWRGDNAFYALVVAIAQKVLDARQGLEP